MAVLINFKICDNAKECGGLAVCPTGALSWDEKNENILIDNDKCISCGLCEKECPIGAIKIAKTDEEFNKIKKEIDDDTRTTKDLFVDRYGAVAISSFFKIDINEIPEKIKKDCLTIIEIYNPETAECLLKSIPIQDLTKNLPENTLYYKVESENFNEYCVTELPSLLLFKNNNLLGHIDGYYDNDNIEEIQKQIDDILKH